MHFLHKSKRNYNNNNNKYTAFNLVDNVFCLTDDDSITLTGWLLGDYLHYIYMSYINLMRQTKYDMCLTFGEMHQL